MNDPRTPCTYARAFRTSGRAAGAALALGLGLLLGGCASGGGARAETLDGAAEDPERIFVRVVNDTGYRLRVEALTEVQEVYIGDISAVDEATFELPPTVTLPSGKYRLQADPVGSMRCYRSDDVFASPGDVIEWRLWGEPGAACIR